jgi:predicted dehydrogenase
MPKTVRAGRWFRNDPSSITFHLMVEHFADAVLKKTSLNYSPDDSIANMRVLDALSDAARTGNTVSISPKPDNP